VSRWNVPGHDRAGADRHPLENERAGAVEHAPPAKPVQQILECGKHWQNLSGGSSPNAIAESSLPAWRAHIKN
jgi:hypothetical protein